MKTLGITKWTDADCERVIQRAMYIRLSKSCGMPQALAAAQDELKLQNKKTHSALRQLAKSPQFKKVTQKLRREMPESFAPLFESFASIKHPATLPIKKQADGTIDREPLKVRVRSGAGQSKINWTMMEGAKVGKEVARLLSDTVSRRFRNRPWRFVDYVSEAQIVLPENRRKTFPALQALDRKGELKKIIDDGIASSWILTNDPAPTASEARPPAAPEVPAMAPASPAGSTLDAVTAALSAALQAHALHVVRNEIAPTLAGIVREVVREEIRGALGGLSGGLGVEVRRLIEAELGPLQAAPAGSEPAPIPPPASPDLEPVHTKPRALVVDVVGLLPGQAEIVREKINGSANLRFISSDDAARTHMRENVIVCTKFINHSTEAQARKSRSKLVRVNGGPQSAIKAIEALLQSNG